MRLSVVIPCFNEAEALPTTHAELGVALASLPVDEAEIVYVDDGSTDSTPDILEALHAEDPRVRVVMLSRNFGHQMALSAGLEHCTGDAVVVMDADLQDPPTLLAAMLERWREGAQVVYGVRTGRSGESWFKRASAKWFYRLIHALSRVPIPLDAGDFRLLDRCVVDALLEMPERDRYVRGMVAWAGFKQVPLHYSRPPRQAGTSKYPLRRMLSFAGAGLLSFTVVPLRLATLMGFGASGLALLGIVYALAVRMFSDSWITGWTMLFIAILFLGGVQLLFLGVLGEYLGRIYGEVKRRPLYIVQRRLGCAPRDGGTERA